jgi:hypothetical protein
MNRKTIALQLLVLAVSAVSVSAQFDEYDFADYVWTKIRPVLCGLYYTFAYIAGALCALMFVIAGVRWIGSSDDPGVRKSAKETIIHSIVGLAVILASAAVVDLLIAGQKCW